MGVKVTYVDSAGQVRVVEAEPGVSVMEAAQAAGVPEIEADCGGVCACATCHVLVDAPWLDRLAPMGKIENSLLGLLETRAANSRLSCQIKLTEALDGLTVHTLEPATDG